MTDSPRFLHMQGPSLPCILFLATSIFLGLSLDPSISTNNISSPDPHSHSSQHDRLNLFLLTNTPTAFMPTLILDSSSLVSFPSVTFHTSISSMHHTASNTLTFNLSNTTLKFLREIALELLPRTSYSHQNCWICSAIHIHTLPQYNWYLTTRLNKTNVLNDIVRSPNLIW